MRSFHGAEHSGGIRRIRINPSSTLGDMASRAKRVRASMRNKEKGYSATSKVTRVLSKGFEKKFMQAVKRKDFVGDDIVVAKCIIAIVKVPRSSDYHVMKGGEKVRILSHEDFYSGVRQLLRDKLPRTGIGKTIKITKKLEDLHVIERIDKF